MLTDVWKKKIIKKKEEVEKSIDLCLQVMYPYWGALHRHIAQRHYSAKQEIKQEGQMQYRCGRSNMWLPSGLFRAG